MVKRNKFKYLNKKEKFEIFIYQLLGVNTFKEATLLLEHIIHYRENKDIEDEKLKKHNINYHPKDTSLQGLKDFKKFLYYNGFIHVKNSLIYSLIIIPASFIPGVRMINMVLIPLLIMNLYCIMLQRYTYLRTQETIRMKERQNEISINAKVNKLEKINNELELIDKNQIDEELINRIIAYLNNEDDVILTEADVKSLEVINHYLELLKTKDLTPAVANNNEDKMVLTLK